MAYADVLGAIGQGQQFVDGLFQQQARRQAGGQVARGNLQGAASTLLQQGELQAGVALQDRQAEQTAASRAEQDAQRAQQLQTTLQVTGALRRVRDQGGDVAAELPRYRDTFIAMGTDPQQLQQIESQITANPAFLDQIENITGQQLRELEIVNYGSGRGGVAIDKATGEIVNQFAPTPEPLINNNVIRDPVTFEVIADDRNPEYIQRDPTKELLDVSPAAGEARGGVSERSTPEAVLDGIIQREGGFVARDGRSGAPANFGINQRANPDIDVRNLTEGAARDIYRQRYINPILEAGVSGPALDAVVDFGVNAGVNRSLEFWRRSGGDINRFNELRLEHYRSLPDYAQNGRSWERRVRETTPGSSGSVSSGGGPRVVSAAQAPQLSPAQQASQSAQTFTQERQLRTEFGNNPAVKTLATVRPQVQIIGDIARRATAGEPISAADDLALIFSYMKMLDPGSVVREGEFANAQNTAGIPERIVNAYNRALDGTRLSDSQRNEFFRSATGVMRGYQDSYNEVVTRQRGLAESYGLDADRIAPQAPPPSAQNGRRRIPFTEAQIAASRAIPGGPSGPRGSATNPINVNVEDERGSLANIRPGSHFFTPSGERLVMPNPNPYRRAR